MEFAPRPRALSLCLPLAASNKQRISPRYARPPPKASVLIASPEAWARYAAEAKKADGLSALPAEVLRCVLEWSRPGRKSRNPLTMAPTRVEEGPNQISSSEDARARPSEKLIETVDALKI